MEVEIRRYCSRGGALSSRYQPSPTLSGLGILSSAWNLLYLSASYEAMAWLVGYLAPRLNPRASQSFEGM
eukprot:2281506-Pyramimonas_sp.AAC.1